MSWPIDIIKCELVTDNMTHIQELISSSDTQLGNWMINPCGDEELAHLAYVEPSDVDYTSPEKLVDDLLLLSSYGVAGEVIVADQFHELTRYFLPGYAKVFEYKLKDYVWQMDEYTIHEEDNNGN